MKRVKLVVPLAGNGQRFLDAGYKIPKPMIHITENESIIEHSMGSIDYSECDLIFLVRREHITNFQIDEFLIQRFGKDIKIIPVDYQTGGSTETVLLALNEINNDNPLLIWCSDVRFEMKEGKKFNPYKDIPSHTHGHLLCFKSNSENYSYCQIDKDRYVTKVAEKMVISEWANAGLYWFERGSFFVKYAREMIEKNDKTNREFYLAPLYNYMVRDNLVVDISEVENIWIFGTPSEYDFYKKCTLNRFGDGVVGIACDHSGWELAQTLKDILKDYDIKYIDFGTHSNKSCDYVDKTSLLIKSMKEGECSHGFLLCRTGAGQNMYANRFSHIRSVLVNDEYTAEMAISHNCANVFSIPSKYVDEFMLWKIIDVLSKTKFSGGRHEVRVRKIMDVRC